MAKAGTLVGNSAVYIMTAEGTDNCKIGYSGCPHVRAKGIGAGGLGRARIAWAIRFPDGHARMVERRVHEILKRKGWHASREWFACTPRFAAAVIMSVAKEMGVTTAPEMPWETYRGNEF